MSQGIETTFAFIKPDAVAAGHKDAILKRVTTEGFEIVAQKELTLTEEQAQNFYAEHLRRPFFPTLVSFMTSGPVVALALRKPGAIKAWRELAGPTNSLVAKEQAPTTLRALYGTDNTRNAVHGSDASSSAARELKLILNYDVSQESHEQKSTPIVGYAAKVKGGVPELWSYEPRALRSEDVHIQISHCGICYSDIHTIDSDWGETQYPVIPGHEIVGTITQVGSAVKHLKIGDRVGVGAMVDACRTCKYCTTDNDSYCNNVVWTYNSSYPDGTPTQGGYAAGVRVPSHYAFPIPDALESAAAAPLLCAGATVYSPLARFQTGPGKRVAVIGIGGLGHLAVQFASKMGAEVTAVSTSDDKKELAAKLGAHHFLNSNDTKAMAQAKNTFEIIICTINHSTNWDSYVGLCDLDGTFCFVGLPAEKIPIHAFSFVLKRVKVTGSLIGGQKEVQATLEFAAKHGVRSCIEELPMSQVGQGIARVRENKARFRVVLHN